MSRLLVPALVLAALAAPVQAQEKKEDPAHDELRALRDALVKAVNEKDIDGVLKLVHPNATIVWQNAEVSRGHKGVREYYEKALTKPDAPLKSYTVSDVNIPELSILYGGDTAVVHGTMKSRFEFNNGQTFETVGPWNAALVKEDGKWQIATLHASVGLFDNPLAKAATGWLYWAGGIGAAVGLVVGVLGTLLLRRKKPA